MPTAFVSCWDVYVVANVFVWQCRRDLGGSAGRPSSCDERSCDCSLLSSLEGFVRWLNPIPPWIPAEICMYPCRSLIDCNGHSCSRETAGLCHSTDKGVAPTENRLKDQSIYWSVCKQYRRWWVHRSWASNTQKLIPINGYLYRYDIRWWTLWNE